jgi:hypothetical protein
MNNKPTYLCIGVQKGGTSSLKNYLNQHPEIYMLNNESHYFDNVEPDEKNIILYEKRFLSNNNKKKPIIGEGTPSYCYLPYAIDRIYSYKPHIKLIIILREPISRAYSQFNMNFSDRMQTFLPDIMKEKGVRLRDIKANVGGGYIIVRGFYDEQLEYIYSKFDRSQIYVGISEEIKRNKNCEYNKIFKFLGTTNEIVVDEKQDCRIGKYKKPIKLSDAKALYDIYKPHNERLYELLGRKIDSWEAYYKTLL